MNPELLLNHFDRISEALDAVSRLRRFILDLAVRGKLADQDPNDEPIEKLLALCDITRKATAKSDRRADEEPQTLLAAEDRWHVPSTWGWRALADLVLFIDYRGQTPNKVEQGVRLITAKNVKKGFINLTPEEFLSESNYGTWMTRGLPKLGDVLFTTEAPMGNAAVVRLSERFALAQRVICFRSYDALVPDFLVLQLLSDCFQAILDKTATGLTAKGIKAAKLKRLPIALPPLAEQQRIVAKVDELMALCDRLEAQQCERERRRDLLSHSAFRRLDTAATPKAFKAHASFCINHLPTLTSRPEQIQLFRRNILNLAIRGILVPQSLKDESASVLLGRIQKKNVKYQAAESPSSENGAPFHLPSGWRWIKFGQIITDADAGWSPKSEGFPRSGDNWGVLKVSAVSWDRFLPGENKQLLPDVKPREQARVHREDFLISRANTSELVAKCVVVKEEPRNLILSDKIVRLQIAEECSKDFYCLVNNHADYARAYYAQEASGTSHSMKNVSREVIYKLPIPLPPAAEQRRIVTKVDELMALCDRLEAQLAVTKSESGRLLESVLHHCIEDAKAGVALPTAVFATQ